MQLIDRAHSSHVPGLEFNVHHQKNYYLSPSTESLKIHHIFQLFTHSSLNYNRLCSL